MDKAEKTFVKLAKELSWSEKQKAGAEAITGKRKGIAFRKGKNIKQADLKTKFLSYITKGKNKSKAVANQIEKKVQPALDEVKKTKAFQGLKKKVKENPELARALAYGGGGIIVGSSVGD